MKQLVLSTLSLLLVLSGYCQSASFVVGGDINYFYPVAFYDGGWASNQPTELIIGRSSVHTDASWRGSLSARFTYHVTDWGNGASFIDADIKNGGGAVLVAGWWDMSRSNGSKSIIIWLRGGGTTYYYSANFGVAPKVYDNTSSDRSLPLQETNGPAHTYKTAIDPYVTTSGLSLERELQVSGRVGIGTNKMWNGDYKLYVEGNMRARKVRVDQSSWADYVFAPTYKLPPLKEVEAFIKQHQHLPEVPSAKEVEAHGLDVGANQTTLLKKIEELTLYIIEQNKKLEAQADKLQALEQEVKALSGKTNSN